MRIKRVFSVWQRHWLVYTKLYKTSFALNFFEPAVYLVAMGFGLGAFVQNIHGQPYINFIAPGIVASSSVFAAVYECTYGTYIRMTFQKTFDAILATPVNLDDLLPANSCGALPRSVIFGITIMIVIALFGLVGSWRIAARDTLYLPGRADLCRAFRCILAIVPGIDSFVISTRSS